MAAVLGVCAIVEPEPSGAGTHKRLGLPGCLVSYVTGVDQCPSCGLTTGFSLIMHGEWGRASVANRAARVVFCFWLLIMLYSFAVSVSGKNLLAYEIPCLAVLAAMASVFWLVSFLRV